MKKVYGCKSTLAYTTEYVYNTNLSADSDVVTESLASSLTKKCIALWTSTLWKVNVNSDSEKFVICRQTPERPVTDGGKIGYRQDTPRHLQNSSETHNK